MISYLIAFLVMLNPFAMFLYLRPVMKELDNKTFYFVLWKVSFISFMIFLFFIVSGNFLFEKVFQINFESFRIFGGIILFSFSWIFIVGGKKALVQLKEDLDDLASEIALPFMVGAGTISITVLMAYELNTFQGILTLLLILGGNFLFISILKISKDNIRLKKFQIAFDKNMEILLRLNGFFLGAIGVNMIITGLENLKVFEISLKIRFAYFYY
jgi:multiple antibiotic resistance protein